jgi:hypothetical protein
VKITPWSTDLLQKLTAAQVVNIITDFFGNGKSITVFTISRNWTYPEPQ